MFAKIFFKKNYSSLWDAIQLPIPATNVHPTDRMIKAIQKGFQGLLLI